MKKDTQLAMDAAAKYQEAGNKLDWPSFQAAFDMQQEIIDALDMAIHTMGVDYGSELEKKDDQYLSCVKQRQEFRNALTAERERVAKLRAAIEKSISIADDCADSGISAPIRKALKETARGRGISE